MSAPEACRGRARRGGRRRPSTSWNITAHPASSAASQPGQRHVDHLEPRRRPAGSSTAASMAGSTSGSRTRPITGRRRVGRRRTRARAAPCPSIDARPRRGPWARACRATAPAATRRRAGSGPTSSSAPRCRSRPTGCGSTRPCRCRWRCRPRPSATATALPLELPPGMQAGSSGLTGRAEVRVDAGAAAGQLVQVGLAHDGARRRPAAGARQAASAAAGSARSASTAARRPWWACPPRRSGP